jgi:predicted GTPase
MSQDLLKMSHDLNPSHNLTIVPSSIPNNQLNLTKVEIVLPKVINPIICVLGKTGSGKSSLLNALRSGYKP